MFSSIKLNHPELLCGARRVVAWVLVSIQMIGPMICFSHSAGGRWWNITDPREFGL